MARSPHEEAPDPMASARSAGLRYVSDCNSGFRRVKGPLGFRYTRTDGRLVRNAADLKRIRALAIPPAWTDVGSVATRKDTCRRPAVMHAAASSTAITRTGA